MPLHILHSFFRKKDHLITADIIAKEIALLGNSLLLPSVQIKGDRFDSDLHEITVQKDNIMVFSEVPKDALALSLDDFSKMYLQPIADKLYTVNISAEPDYVK